MARALPRVVATFLVVLLVVELASTASASYVTVYKGPGCKYPAENYKCGCHSIEYYGGFKYYYDGKPAVFYKYDYCKGYGYAFYGHKQYCNNYHGWKSVYIKC
ncbi:unnamed protein product [Victoria cruziana]